MRAFVTGSTGLLGANLTRALRDDGWEVAALTRSPEKGRRQLGDTGAQLVAGDMTDVPSFAASLAGCEVLFHCAAYFREYYGAGDHWPHLERVNVRGTIELLDAAATHGVEKVVYVSSSGVFDRGGARAEVTEESPYAVDTENLYFRSKIEAERAVLRWHETHGGPVAIVNPGWLFGPWDDAPTASGRLVLDYLARRLPAIPPGGETVADARDVARGMVAAAESGRPGERYILGGHPVTLREILMTLQELTGVAAPRLRVPYPIALVIAWASEAAARLRGTDTLVTVVGIRTLREGHKCALSSRKAADELGATFRPLADTLRDELAWFRERGRLNRPAGFET